MLSGNTWDHISRLLIYSNREPLHLTPRLCFFSNCLASTHPNKTLQLPKTCRFASNSLAMFLPSLRNLLILLQEIAHAFPTYSELRQGPVQNRPHYIYNRSMPFSNSHKKPAKYLLTLKEGMNLHFVILFYKSNHLRIRRFEHSHQTSNRL